MASLTSTQKEQLQEFMNMVADMNKAAGNKTTTSSESNNTPVNESRSNESKLTETQKEQLDDFIKAVNDMNNASRSANENTASNTQTSESKADDSFSKLTSQVYNNENLIKNMALVNTKTLISKNYDDDVLAIYFNKFILNRVLNNSFNYSDRQKSTNGLGVAVIVLGTLHYCCAVRAIYSLNSIQKEFFSRLGNDKANKAKFVLGILDDYESEALSYDNMPTKEQMMGYIDKYVAIDTKQTFEQFMGMSDVETEWAVGTDGTVEIREKVPDEMPFQNIHVAFNDNGDVVVMQEPRATQNITRLSKDDYIDTCGSDKHAFKIFGKKLFSSANGIDYEFKQRWKFIISKIDDKFKNKSLVTRLAFVGTQIIVNNTPLRLTGIIGGEYDIRLEDIIDIKKTLKHYKNVKHIIFDYATTQCFIREYGYNDTGINKIFMENPRLLYIGFIPAGSSEPINYSRETIERTAATLNKQLKIEASRMQLEQEMAKKNPMVHKQSIGYTRNFFRNSKSVSANLFNSSKNALMDKNPKLIKATAYSLIGTVTIAAGGLIGAIGGIGSGIKKIGDMFKK